MTGVCYQEETLKSLLLNLSGYFSPLSAVTLTAIPYALQCSHIRASHQLPWFVFLVFTLYQPAVLLCGVQDSQQQLCPTESTWHLQPQLHNVVKQKDLILSSLQSISTDLQVEDLKLKLIIRALCSWKCLHQTAGFCAELHSIKTCWLSQVRGSWRGPETAHSCFHVSQRIHLCYLKQLQAHYLSVKHLGNFSLA